jgi:hypothetical protein
MLLGEQVVPRNGKGGYGKHEGHGKTRWNDTLLLVFSVLSIAMTGGVARYSRHNVECPSEVE